MKSQATARFWNGYAALPQEIRRLADKGYALWSKDPWHASLHFKPLAGFEDLWSVRVGRQYRALARRKGEKVAWVWIGHHSEYDALLRQR